MTIDEKTLLLKKAFELESRKKLSDSKMETDKISQELTFLYPSFKKLNGTLVQIGAKKARIWHSHYGVFKFYLNNRYSYNWSNNYGYLEDNFQIIEENNEELLEKVQEIDSEVYHLQEKISELGNQKALLLKDFIFYVDPESFRETDEVNRSAFSLNGEKVYITETFCELTNTRITS